jgi:hypothetical protein
MSGKTPGAMYGRLADSPVCDAGGSDAYVLQKPGRPSPCATS